MVVARGSRIVLVGLVGVLIASSLVLSACNTPPVLTSAQVEAKKLPKRHPHLNDAQTKNCTSCHKVVDKAPQSPNATQVPNTQSPTTPKAPSE